MDRVSSVLVGVLARRGLQSHADGALIVYRATHWIGGHLPAMAGVLHVQNYKEGTLSITADHSIALHECTAVMADLKTYLASECAFARIADIRISRA